VKGGGGGETEDTQNEGKEKTCNGGKKKGAVNYAFGKGRAPREKNLGKVEDRGSGEKEQLRKRQRKMTRTMNERGSEAS